jgi:hypothetical protein
MFLILNKTREAQPAAGAGNFLQILIGKDTLTLLKKITAFLVPTRMSIIKLSLVGIY